MIREFGRGGRGTKVIGGFYGKVKYGCMAKRMTYGRFVVEWLDLAGARPGFNLVFLLSACFQTPIELADSLICT